MMDKAQVFSDKAREGDDQRFAARSRTCACRPPPPPKAAQLSQRERIQGGDPRGGRRQGGVVALPRRHLPVLRVAGADRQHDRARYGIPVVYFLAAGRGDPWARSIDPGESGTGSLREARGHPHALGDDAGAAEGLLPDRAKGSLPSPRSRIGRDAAHRYGLVEERLYQDAVPTFAESWARTPARATRSWTGCARAMGASPEKMMLIRTRHRRGVKSERERSRHCCC